MPVSSKRNLSILVMIIFSGSIMARSGLINLNPDPDDEPWIAGGVDEKEWIEALSDAKEFELPQRGALSKLAALPSSVDNTTHPAFRPIFNQKGGSCAQASGVAYVFTYEINCLRGLPSNTLENQYPYDFTYNFLNNGNGESGTNTNNGWNIIKNIGIPNARDYGGFGLGNFTEWVSGYDVYYKGMENRLKEYFQITIRKPEDIEKMKQWLVDRANGSPEGGCLVFAAYAEGEQIKKLASGTPEAGKSVVVNFGTSGGHSMTIAGYNDQICYDYNGDGKFTNDIDLNEDGKLDIRDWEIGAALLVNSWGSRWGDGGKAWVMYKVLASGIFNSQLAGIRLYEDSIVKPKLTFKFSISHPNRSMIRIEAGYSNTPTRDYPTSSMESFSPAFTFCGGAFPMQGETDEPIEIGLDISNLLEKTGNKDAAFFLKIDSKSGSGLISNLCLIDYTTDQPIEYPYHKSLDTFSTGTTYFKIIRPAVSKITVVSPNGQEKWERGKAYYIEWDYTSIEDNVRIELFKNGTVLSVLENSVPNSGHYLWNIPEDQELDSSYQICITSVNDSNCFDKSDQPFSIQRSPIFLLTSPNSHEMLLTGSSVDISWKDGYNEDVKIDIYRNGIYAQTIADKVSGSNSYKWVIPDSFQSGFDYRIRVVSVNNKERFDECDSNLIIMHPLMTAPYVQTFDAFEDGYKIVDSWEQITGDDDIDWRVTEGPTPYRDANQGGTGAPGDHSSKNGRYLYVNSSAPNNPGKTAVLLSPLIDFRNSSVKNCHFWVHMFSSENTMGNLVVDVNANGNWIDSVLFISGDQGDKWIQQTIGFSAFNSDFIQIRFRAQTGADDKSDICIDDFMAGTVGVFAINTRPLAPSVQVSFKRGFLHFQNYEGFAKVISLDGTVIRSVNKVSHNSTMDISGLSSGTYLLLIDRKAMKFVKAGAH